MRAIRSPATPFLVGRLLSGGLLAAVLVLGLVLAPGPLAQAAPAPQDVALLRTLKKQRLKQISFKKSDLKTIVKWLRVATSKNIVIKRVALAKADIEWADLRYTVELKDVSAWLFLQDILLKPHGMSLKIKGNIVFITSKADSYGKPVTRLYGISHITFRKVDFIGPDINLTPSGYTPDVEYEPERVVEDDPLSSGEAVAELVKELLLPKSWEANDSWRIRATDRYLVVRAPRDVQRLIPGTLSKIAAMK